MGAFVLRGEREMGERSYREIAEIREIEGNSQGDQGDREINGDSQGDQGDREINGDSQGDQGDQEKSARCTLIAAPIICSVQRELGSASRFMTFSPKHVACRPRIPETTHQGTGIQHFVQYSAMTRDAFVSDADVRPSPRYFAFSLIS
jgi:hypothetical protein